MLRLRCAVRVGTLFVFVWVVSVVGSGRVGLRSSVSSLVVLVCSSLPLLMLLVVGLVVALAFGAPAPPRSCPWRLACCRIGLPPGLATVQHP